MKIWMQIWSSVTLSYSTSFQTGGYQHLISWLTLPPCLLLIYTLNTWRFSHFIRSCFDRTKPRIWSQRVKHTLAAEFHERREIVALLSWHVCVCQQACFCTICAQQTLTQAPTSKVWGVKGEPKDFTDTAATKRQTGSISVNNSSALGYRHPLSYTHATASTTLSDRSVTSGFRLHFLSWCLS